MKFIFPQNYNFKNKLFGLIDYSTVVLNVFWYVFIYFAINIFIFNVNVKIFCFIVFCFPLTLLSIIGFNHENIIYVFIYFFKFIINTKLYLYIKSNH